MLGGGGNVTIDTLRIWHFVLYGLCLRGCWSPRGYGNKMTWRLRALAAAFRLNSQSSFRPQPEQTYKAIKRNQCKYT